MRFKRGDIVKISKKSRWLNDGSVNPANTEGEIIELNTDTGFNVNRARFQYRVDWGEERKAYYDDKDLGLVRRADAV